MASNPIGDVLMRSLSNSAQAGLAKYGGYGGVADPSTGQYKAPSGFANVLNLALQGLSAAFPQSPVFSGANAINQARNVSKYNQYLVQQAQQAQNLARQANQNNAGVYADTTGLSIRNPDAGFDTGFVGGAMPQIRQNNANPALRQLINGETVTMDDNRADYSGLPVKEMLGRANDVNDSNVTGAALRTWMDEQLPGLADKLGLPPVTPTDQQGGTLQASANKQQMITPGEALQHGVIDWNTVLTGRSNEQTNRRGNRTIDETKRHNQAGEGIQSREASVKEGTLAEQRKYGYWKRPPGGSGSQNPLTVPKAMQDYLSNQLEAVDTQLSSLGVNTKISKWNPLSKGIEKEAATQPSEGGLFGIGAVSSEQAAKNRKINALIEQRNQILGQISGPFGGQSKQNLESAPSSFSAWKQGKR